MRKYFIGSVFALLLSMQLFAQLNADQQSPSNEPELQRQLVELKERRIKIVSLLGQAHPMVKTLSARIKVLEGELATTNPKFAQQLEELKQIEDPAARNLIEKLLFRIEVLEKKLEELDARVEE